MHAHDPGNPDALASIARRGGLAATHELAHDGISRGRLAALVRSGRLLRVRQGWYSRPGLHPDLHHAARVGGLLTCSSALALAGFWVIDDGRLHVAVEPNDCRLRSPRDARRRLQPSEPVTVHWTAQATPPRASRLSVDPVRALIQLADCVERELLTAAADSVLRRRPSLAAELRRASVDLPWAARRAVLEADGVCESGIETLFWLRMRHLDLRRQVVISGLGRVDFVLGRQLVVEVDGAAFHSGPEEFESDRRRDALLSARGYRVLRFSYRQVLERWPEVHAAVWAAVLRGDRG
jgi:very-short-patch-repair endonuclease